MKPYYLTIIGLLLLAASYLVAEKEVQFNTYDTIFMFEKTFLLQIAAAGFLLVALILKITKFTASNQ